MASAEQGLVTFLSGSHLSPQGSAVTAIVGSRVFFDRLPQGVIYPCLRIQRISTNLAEFRSIDTGIADYARARFQIDCWALSRLAAIELAQAVFVTIEAARGVVGDLRIDPCETEDEAGDLEEGIGPGSADVYRQRLDVFVPYTLAA